MIKRFCRTHAAARILCALLAAVPATLSAQQPDSAAVIRMVDAAVQARVDNVARYTVTEHYTVFRGKDETHPAAAMTVHTTYTKESGKDYAIVDQSGSALVRKLVLGTILDNEKKLSAPEVQKDAWIDSANYEMKLHPGGAQLLDAQNCYVLDLTPRRKSPYLIVGTVWVDAKDGSIVRLEGTGASSSSVFTGPTQVLRQYVMVDGYAQATQVRAVSDSKLLGQTVVTIDYTDYKMELRPHP
jgi:hypothetical protein